MWSDLRIGHYCIITFQTALNRDQNFSKEAVCVFYWRHVLGLGTTSIACLQNRRHFRENLLNFPLLSSKSSKSFLKFAIQWRIWKEEGPDAYGAFVWWTKLFMHVKIWKVREHVDVRVHVVVRTTDRSSYRIRDTAGGWGWSRYSKRFLCQGIFVLP